MNDNKFNIYNIIVIGSGLAGSEAGLISARFGLKTLIINISMDTPSVLKYSGKIGGIFNDCLLNKINALEGFINNAIYETKIAQKTERENDYFGCSNLVDKGKFTLFYKYCLENQENLHTRQGLVTDIKIENEDKKYTVKLSDGSIFFSQAVIVTVGTFLNATVFWGKNEIPAGRHGEINSKILYENLKIIGYDFNKEKVFICPRIDKRSVNLKKIKKVKSEVKSNIEGYKETECAKGYHKDVVWQKYYSFKTSIKKDEILKYCNKIINNYKEEKLQKLINIERDKLKLEDSKNDQLEIEMFSEGDSTNELYLNKFNFAFSDKEQNMILNKIYGLEDASIIRPGYYIEYEGLRKEQLTKNFESNIHKNIFFAGEVNGPSSYENIALQGLTAGISAALSIAENTESISNRELIKISKMFHVEH